MSIIQLAKYVVLYCNLNGIDISHLKLQKLLYYIQSWHLVYFEKELLFNDTPEAWLNGPVYTTVYSDYFHKQGYKMNDLIVLDQDNSNLEKEYSELSNKLANKAALVDKVLLKYSTLTAEKLVLLTHCEMPWSKAREKCEEMTCREPISIDDMYSYYSSLITNKA